VVVQKGFCIATKSEEWSIEVVDAIGWERVGAEGSTVELVASFATGLINRSKGQPQQACGGLPKILPAPSTNFEWTVRVWGRGCGCGCAARGVEGVQKCLARDGTQPRRCRDCKAPR
jgi:hypothetical protein